MSSRRSQQQLYGSQALQLNTVKLVDSQVYPNPKTPPHTEEKLNTPLPQPIQNTIKPDDIIYPDNIQVKTLLINAKNKAKTLKNNPKHILHTQTTVADVLAPLFNINNTGDYMPFSDPIEFLLISLVVTDKNLSSKSIDNILQIFQIIKENKIDITTANIPKNHQKLRNRMDEILPKFPMGKF